MNKGFWLAVGAYGLWGFFPLYWKQLHDVPALEVVAHRAIWSLVFLAGVVLVSHRGHELRRAFKKKKVVLVYSIAAALLSLNWLVFIWGINAGYVVEASLGYFINPLVSVLLGVIFFKERLRLWQWVAIAIAAAGVMYLTIGYGQLPWIALVLAFSFGSYGLIKKLASLDALIGQTMEMTMVFAPAVAFLAFREVTVGGGFVHAGALPTVLLILGGAVTAIPLLMFAGAARRIPLSTVGILQYIAPTMQFIIGVWVYGEDFSITRVIGFSIIWFALAIYTSESLLWLRKRPAEAEAVVPVPIEL